MTTSILNTENIDFERICLDLDLLLALCLGFALGLPLSLSLSPTVHCNIAEMPCCKKALAKMTSALCGGFWALGLRGVLAGVE